MLHLRKGWTFGERLPKQGIEPLILEALLLRCSAHAPILVDLIFSASLCSLNCHKEGHLVKDCPEDKICRRCGEVGHIAADCCNAVRCNRCFQEGHFAKDCPNAVVCNICNQSGHKSDACPNRAPFVVCSIKHCNGTQRGKSWPWFRSSPARPE